MNWGIPGQGPLLFSVCGGGVGSSDFFVLVEFGQGKVGFLEEVGKCLVPDGR